MTYKATNHISTVLAWITIPLLWFPLVLWAGIEFYGSGMKPGVDPGFSDWIGAADYKCKKLYRVKPNPRAKIDSFISWAPVDPQNNGYGSFRCYTGEFNSYGREKSYPAGYVYFICGGPPENQANFQKTGICSAPASGPTNCPVREGNPIFLGTGSKYQREEDYRGVGAFPLRIVRYFNSMRGLDANSSPDGINPLGNIGYKWATYYHREIQQSHGYSAFSVHAYRPTGESLGFVYENGSWVSGDGSRVRLEYIYAAEDTVVGWRLKSADDFEEIYDVSGRLTSVLNPAGLKHTLTYDNLGRIQDVTDSFGTQLIYHYDISGRIASIEAPGAVYRYEYDAIGNLIAVVFPDTTPDESDNPRRLYHYEDSRFRTFLTGITDENDKRYANFEYDNLGRATASYHGPRTEVFADRIDGVTISYDSEIKRTITNAAGAARTYDFENINGAPRFVRVTGDKCVNAGHGGDQQRGYDSEGHIVSRIDWNGHVTTYDRDGLGRELSRTEASGAPEERTVTTQWHSVFSKPLSITEPRLFTEFVYDDAGRIKSKTEHPTP